MEDLCGVFRTEKDLVNLKEKLDNYQEEYNRLIEKEVKEICTNYGPWFEFWFDGGAHGPEQGGPDVLSIVEKYQPQALFYHNLQRADARWGGSESGTVAYPCWATFPYQSTGAGESAREHISRNNFELLKTGDPNGKYWVPAMSDAPLRGIQEPLHWEKHDFPSCRLNSVELLQLILRIYRICTMFCPSKG